MLRGYFKPFVFILGLISIVGSVAQAAVVATVNGKAISDSELRAAVSNLNEIQQQEILNDPLSRKQVVDRLIDQEVLVQQAGKQKVEESSQYKATMEAFKKQLLSNLLLEKSLTPQMTDRAAHEYFNLKRQEYTTDQVHAMHILSATEQESRQILEQARKPGADFQALAEKNSKDPSAKNNRGDLGFFNRDQWDQKFTEAAFSGKKDDVLGPVKTAYGYHVIKVIDRKPGRKLNYDEVELKVKAGLKEKLMREYIAKLRSQAKITVPAAQK